MRADEDVEQGSDADVGGHEDRHPDQLQDGRRSLGRRSAVEETHGRRIRRQSRHRRQRSICQSIVNIYLDLSFCSFEKSSVLYITRIYIAGEMPSYLQSRKLNRYANDWKKHSSVFP